MHLLLISRSIITLSKLYNLQLGLSKFVRRTIQSGLFSENLVFSEISHFTTFAESWYSALRRGLANFTPALISRSIATMPKLHRKLAVTVIFRRFSILRNFTFCNFCQNLVFQTLQEDWETLQQLLYHSIITTTKLLTKPGFRAIFRKLVICKISHFTNFNRSLVYFPWVKRFTTLNLLITLNGINMTPAFLKKGPINSLLKKVVFCEISHFATFPKYFFHLLQAP